MKTKFDVAVIGAGIMGLSTAYYLLKEGYKVVLLEKNEIGSGASGACDDMILLQSKKPGISLEMSLESLEMYRALSKELNTDIQFETRGGMIVIEDQEQLRVMEDFVSNQKKYGLEVEIIDKKDVFKKQPHITEKIIASTYSTKDSQVNPFCVMKGFLAKGIDLGLDIKRNICIKEIVPRKDYWKIILQDDHYIEAEKIVNTSGAWAAKIGDMIGIDIPITPKKGQICVTEQIPQLGETNVWSAEYMVAKMNPELIKNQNPLFKELGIGFAFSQAIHGNYLIGSTRENVGFNKETNYEALKLLVNQAIKFFPILNNVHIIRSFAGFRPASLDGKPIVGEVSERKGFYIAAGHEGDGIALVPITGKLMADLISKKHIYYDMEELNIQRFNKKEEVEKSKAISV
ncbi:sarcosine oxidase subunit beta [Anaerovirgula multivorans]|uniref:Sarcosine oxidase subunit beta n=1 Tax=Anaerovirgula multivorans TaxID=312168 RepID=A0A239KSH3_9FIRM|nr:FAD-dependent oxidoreductase [Anaerovirgula multivorans]SNT21307.1 sarcosine oxidase subunit beta [Anaerovirgula multivorans]